MQGQGAHMSGEGSLSFGALIQQSAATLENECAVIEARIEEKTRDVEELKKLCSRQAENNAKQQSDLEHEKVQTHFEETQNKAHYSKICNIREKLQVLEKYFGEWGKTINPILNYKGELKEIITQLKVQEESEKASYEQLEHEYKYYIEKANEALYEVQELRDGEKSEFSKCKTHFKTELENHKQQERELEPKLQVLQSDCREKGILIGILGPQNAEFKKTLETLKTEFSAEKEQVDQTINQLETSLQDSLDKKKKLAADIQAADQKINDISSALGEKETEAQVLGSKQKLLNAEEEEYAKIWEIQQQELQELENTVAELKEQFNKFIRIEEENVTLKVKYEELHIENENYKKKIGEVDSSAEFYYKEIDLLNKSIEEVEIEHKNTNNDQMIIKGKLKELQKELDDDKNEHKNLSLKIEETLVEQQNKNDKLIYSLKSLSDQLLEAAESKNNFEKVLKELEREASKARAISQESDFKLSNYHEECKLINNHYREEIITLDEEIDRSREDYEKAMAECVMNEDIKKQIKKLETDLENKQKHSDQHMEQLQASYTKEIEEKQKLMGDKKAQCERDFRNKEMLKTEAMMELKEIKAHIIDLQQQKILVEKETVTKVDTIRKCDNLIRKLESKFNKVAQVAITSSQSIADPASQHLNFATPRVQKKQVKVTSPGSDSSGKTFDPDDVNIQKMFQKRAPFKQLPPFTTTQNQPKKKHTPAPPKKNAKEEDDWGFLV